MHLTRELLRAVSRGDLPPRFLARIGLEHLTALCPHCAREVDAWRENPVGAHQIFRGDVLVPLLAAAAPQLVETEEQAERDLKDLLRLPVEARRALVQRARSRFRGPELVRRLLEESRRELHEDSEAAYHLAALALSIADRSVGTFDLQALAAALMANACRARGQLRTAVQHLEYSRFLIDTQDVSQILVLAEIDDLEGSLRKDLRQFRRSEELLLRALALYRLAGREDRCAKVLVVFGCLRFHEGRTPEAVSMLRAGLSAIRFEEDPQLYLFARHNLAYYLTELGEIDEAVELFEADALLFEHYGRMTDRIRRRWLEGLIARETEEPLAAERALREARDAFLERGLGLLAALVSIDLADLYLCLERTADVRALAETMFPIFEAHDVHREALAALVLFQEAAQREGVTTTLIRSLRTYLRNALADRDLKFQAID